MPLTSLTPLLAEADTRKGALLGMVCLGWEDAAEFVAAGEATGVPVILQAGPGARKAIPLPVWGTMFRSLADSARIPVVAHLDHGRSEEECRAALEAGFSSVMYDGSALPLEDNIRITNRVAKLARAHGASVEAEVGFVGYADGAPSDGTIPDEAERFANETDIDCLAVSVGNLHLSRRPETPIDFKALANIQTRVDVPLVLHGGSGVPHDERLEAIQDHRVRKINLGTEVRQAYGAALREALEKDSDIFDRLALAAEVARARATLLQNTLNHAWNTANN